MFARLVYQSFLRQRRRKLLAGVAVMLGVTVTTAMIAVATDIGDKMSRELRAYGANLVVYPLEDTLDVDLGGVSLKPASEGAFLNESDLPKIKGIFWRHNIVGFAPFLPVEAEVRRPSGESSRVQLIGTYFDKQLAYGKEMFATGVRATHPWWGVRGDWPRDDAQQVLVGESLASSWALAPGDTLEVAGERLTVTGILSTGSAEDNAIVAPLALAQQIAGRPGSMRQVLVSALTKPEDDFARRDPATMTPEMFDRWYCSPYANSIALQLKEVIGGSNAEQIRRVAQNEGTVLTRIRGLMLLVTLGALLASGLAVGAAMATAILERRREVGLMKAIGAGTGTVAALFLVEAAVLAVLAGVGGYAAGAVLAQRVGAAIFGSDVVIHPVLFPIVLAIALIVTLLGSAASIRRAVRLEPIAVLRGDA